MRFVFTQNIRVGDYGLIVGVGRCTVGYKAGLAVCVGREAADFMGYGFPIIRGVLRSIGDNVALFQSGGIYVLDQHQVPCAKVGLAH